MACSSHILEQGCMAGKCALYYKCTVLSHPIVPRPIDKQFGTERGSTPVGRGWNPLERREILCTSQKDLHIGPSHAG